MGHCAQEGRGGDVPDGVDRVKTTLWTPVEMWGWEKPEGMQGRPCGTEVSLGTTSRNRRQNEHFLGRVLGEATVFDSGGGVEA